MLRNAFLKGLRDMRRSFPWWVVGVAVMPILVGLLYPSLEKASAEMQGYVEAMPEAFRQMFIGAGGDFASPVGFLDAELFSFMAPIVFIAFGVAVATAQIAGEEEKGTLNLLLAHPVTRTRLLAEKAGVLAVGLAALALAQFVAVFVAVQLGDMGLSAGQVAEAHVNLFLLTLAFAAIAFAAGAATGNRGFALGVGAIVALASYLLNALAPLNDSTAPLRKASLFYYYGGVQPLRQGFDPVYGAVLLAVAVVALAVGFLTFRRRDIHV